ncbi:MAG: GTPase HflX, partial [Endomicrobiia bacterium]|nr:GTPase HflX [Endomicrobiia bacterium]
DIFARRARSAEGKLQVELAQMNYFLPRITKRFGTFEQQTGGIGTRGPGEKKLEVDRRRIMERIARLKKEIAAIASRRSTLRKSRSRSAVCTVALAGYTNAGKSTLLNRLARVKTVYTDDKLFATLDPVSRAGVLPGGRAVVFTDTVGFIQNLPHELIDAFKSTLEEIKESLVVIHLIDVSSAYWRRQRDVAAETISSLNPDARVIEVYNKADLLPWSHAQSFRRDGKMLLSAETGAGIEELLSTVAKYVEPKMQNAEIFIPYSSSGRLTEIHDLSIITRRRYTDEGVELSIEAPPANLSKIKDIERLCALDIKNTRAGSAASSPMAARRKK